MDASFNEMVSPRTADGISVELTPAYIETLEPNRRTEARKALEAADLLNAFIEQRNETNPIGVETLGYLDPFNGKFSIKTVDTMSGEVIESFS